jgi:predicted aspartyl protease
VRVTLGQVQVGGIALRNVQGSVTLGGRAQLAQVLIGMSFLKDLQVQQSGNTLLLRKPDL